MSEPTRIARRLRGASGPELAAARAQAHRAVQHASLAARASLPAVADDSHSNLAWDPAAQAFVSHPLSDAGAAVAVDLAPFALRLTGPAPAALSLAGVSPAEAAAWLDARLAEAGLGVVGAAGAPYALPSEVAAINLYDAVEALDALAAWYDLAAPALSAFAQTLSAVSPGPSPVRCWPHHFDIATYVALEVGDPETARGVGVGLSPGDEAFDEPYFYVNPWPRPDPSSLPPAPPLAHWRTEGFVGAVATADRVRALDDPGPEVGAYLNEAFARARAALAAG